MEATNQKTKPKAYICDRGNGTLDISVIGEHWVANYEVTYRTLYTKKQMEVTRAEEGAVGADGRMEWTPKQERAFLKMNGYKPIKSFEGDKKLSRHFANQEEAN